MPYKIALLRLYLSLLALFRLYLSLRAPFCLYLNLRTLFGRCYPLDIGSSLFTSYVHEVLYEYS